MKRRRLLIVSLASTAALAVVGGGLAIMQPGLRGGRLTSAGRTIFAAVADAVLDGTLPAGGAGRRAAIDAHLVRLADLIAALSPQSRGELSQLLALLHSGPGRLALCGMASSWADADVREVERALNAMRLSHLDLRQQAFHALRNLTNAAYFSDPSTWSALGYPGPQALS